MFYANQMLILVCHKNCLLIVIGWMHVCEGLVLSFWNAIYITSVGHIDDLPSRKRLTGLCGMFVGVGEIIGVYVCYFAL